jgi:hypothetical protein
MVNDPSDKIRVISWMAFIPNQTRDPRNNTKLRLSLTKIRVI